MILLSRLVCVNPGGPTLAHHRSWSQILAWQTTQYFSTYFLTFFCLLVSSVDNCLKQPGPRSGPTKVRTWSESKLFGTLVVFLTEFSKKLILGGKIGGRQKYKMTQYAKSLNTLWTLGSAMREVVNFKGNLKAGECLLNVLWNCTSVLLWSQLHGAIIAISSGSLPPRYFCWVVIWSKQVHLCTLNNRAGRYYRDTGISRYFISVIRIVIQFAVSRYFQVYL